MGFAVKYERNKIVSSLYETSRPKKGNPLLFNKAENYEVYDFDNIKKIFCEKYRYGKDIKSCDAYFYSEKKDYLIIEFKNTHHLKLKDYYDEIEIKLIDTHMLLNETFWKNKKGNDISKNVKSIVVYNDKMNYGSGVKNIANALNNMIPKSGDVVRNSNNPNLFENDNEFQNAVNNTKVKYEKEFYKEIEFMDKKEFEENYVDTGYFNGLIEWSEMCE